jgi:hypothetical protein
MITNEDLTRLSDALNSERAAESEYRRHADIVKTLEKERDDAGNRWLAAKRERDELLYALGLVPPNPTIGDVADAISAAERLTPPAEDAEGAEAGNGDLLAGIANPPARKRV